MSISDRGRLLQVLRAITDLLESSEDIPEFKADVTFWVRRAEDNAAVAASIISALPGPWAAEQKSYGRDFLEFTARPVPEVSVSVVVPAEDAGTEAGTRTVTVTEWQPIPALAALLESTGSEAGTAE